MNLLSNLSRCLTSKYTVVRFLTARCIGILSMHKIERVLQFIIDSILPKLTNTNMDTSYLQGPIESLYRIKKQIESLFDLILLLIFRCD